MRIEARGDPVGAALVACSADGSSFGIERPGDGGLLDHEARVAGMHVLEHLGRRARLLDDVAQIAAGAHLARAERQRRFLEPGVDQVVLERALVLEVDLRLALG